MAFPRRTVGSLSLVLAVLAGAPPVAAAPVRHVVLAWSEDDPTCMGANDLSSMVERTLGRPVFHADAPPFATLKGAVGRAGPDRFEARIALVGVDGRVLAERTLTTVGECGAETSHARALARPPVTTAAPPLPPPSAAVPSPREGALLLEARRTLGTDPARALTLVRAHEREFPESQLAPERARIAAEARRRLER